MTIASSIPTAWVMALILFLPGWAWLRAGKDDSITATARILGFSLILQLPTWLLLAECGQLTFFAVIAAGLAWTVAGLLRSPGGVRLTREHLFALLILGMVLSIVVIFPSPGEWIVGGWDPGVIMNQGIWVGRTGTLHPPADLLSPVFAADVGGLITRHVSGLREAFPGMPVDPGDGTWSFYFYRGTTLWVSFLYVMGGLPMALRASLILGLLTLLLMVAVIRLWIPGRHAGWIALGLVMIQPVFVYHLRTPGFEMLQILLIMHCFLWLNSNERTLRNAAFMATGFCLLINHVSFILFGTLLAFCLSVYERSRDETRTATTGLSLMAGLLAGLMYIGLLSPSSLAKLHHILPAMFQASALLVILTILAALFAHRLRRWEILLLPAGLTACLAVEMFRHEPFREFAVNVSALASLNGIVLTIAAAAGCLFFYITKPGLRTVMAFLVLCLLTVLQRKHVAELYPWALKRFIPFMVPLVACGGLMAWSHLSKSNRGIIVAVVLGMLVVGENILHVRGAIRNVEYRGLSSRLDEVAGMIPDDAIVIADHFKWGTPLAAIYGRHVINGERIWADKSRDRVEEAMDFIRKHTSSDVPIYWLTVTESGLDIYRAIDKSRIELVHVFAPLPLKEVSHHRNNRGYTDFHQMNVTFSIYRTVPD